MALTETRPETDRVEPVGTEEPAPTQIERLIGTGDHLSNGRLLVGFALVFLALSSLGLVLAGLDRTTADGALGGISDVLWTSSLVALVLMGVLPLLLGLAVYLVPLQVGSPAIAFPRAAALSLWTWLLGSLLFITSVAVDGGIGGSDDDAARIGNLSMGVLMAALALLAVCVATTVWAHRPLGMGLARVPFFSWAMLVAAPIWILTLGSAISHIFIGQITHADAGALAANFDEGIAWFLRAPAIYMLAIPVLGIAADTVAHITGRRLSPYGMFQGAIGAYAVLSFGVWAQSEVAAETIVWVGFAVLAAVPVLALLGGLVDALRRGGMRALASLGGALLALLLVLGAVLAAALQALDTAGSGNLFGFQTLPLGEAQAIFMIAAAALGGLAGVFHWGERIFGAPVGEGAAKGAVGAVLLGGGLAATILIVQAIATADGRAGLEAWAVNGGVALGAVLMALGALAGLAAAVGAARQGEQGGAPAAEEPTGLTLEWASRGLAVSTTAPASTTISSPYPLLDLRDGITSDEESK